MKGQTDQLRRGRLTIQKRSGVHFARYSDPEGIFAGPGNRENDLSASLTNKVERRDPVVRVEGILFLFDFRRKSWLVGEK